MFFVLHIIFVNYIQVIQQCLPFLLCVKRLKLLEINHGEDCVHVPSQGCLKQILRHPLRNIVIAFGRYFVIGVLYHVTPMGPILFFGLDLIDHLDGHDKMAARLVVRRDSCSLHNESALLIVVLTIRGHFVHGIIGCAVARQPSI